MVGMNRYPMQPFFLFLLLFWLCGGSVALPLTATERAYLAQLPPFKVAMIDSQPVHIG